MSIHTPGPWIVDQNMIRQPMLSKRRRIVCPPDHDGIQDAAFIVRACNAHEEMVKALEAILDSGRYDDAGNFVIDCEPWDGQGDPPDTTDPRCIQSAWALIEAEAKAEGRV